MVVTSKSTYAIKFMLALAKAYGSGPVSVAEVAKSESISVKFLESVVAPLRVKGLIKVKRGAHGGYFLSNAPARVSLKNIIDAVEADKLLAKKAVHNHNSPADQVIASVFAELDASIITFFENKNLDDLLGMFDIIRSEQMFYI